MEDLIKLVEEMELRKKEFTKTLRESGIIKTLNSKPVSGTITGVDGSIISEHLHNISLYLVRAMACIMNIEKNRLVSCKYFPDVLVKPELIYETDLEKDEQTQMGSLLRMEKEWKCVKNVLELSDYVLLDGSLLPHPSDVPRNDSKLKPKFQELTELINCIIETSKKRDVPLIGVVKDSTSTLLSQRFGKHYRDTSVLDMGIGEYTEPVESQNLLITYLQTSEYDFPLRIEFPNTFDPEEIINLVFNLSNTYLEFSYPNVLMEADLRVRLERSMLEKYTNIFEKKRRLKKVF